MQLRRFPFFVAAAALAAAMPIAGRAAHGASASALIATATRGSWRSEANRKRDRYRHPGRTLRFFALEPEMTVVELAPGQGWYTEILAPVLRDRGRLVEAVPPADTKNAFQHRMGEAYRAKLAADPALYGRVTLLPFAPPGLVKLGPDGSADMVLTFRNLHDWMNESPQALGRVFAASYAVLKPGGIFGVVEHRARPNADPIQSAKELHRLPEDYVIGLGLRTGFRLDGVSEVNANPRDDESVNVHRLPPNLRGPAAERAAMEAIGESDRMTLRFVKPGRD
jgi:predicted methyltransferase